MRGEVGWKLDYHGKRKKTISLEKSTKSLAIANSNDEETAKRSVSFWVFGFKAPKGGGKEEEVEKAVSERRAGPVGEGPGA